MQVIFDPLLRLIFFPFNGDLVCSCFRDRARVLEKVGDRLGQELDIVHLLTKIRNLDEVFSDMISDKERKFMIFNKTRVIDLDESGSGEE